MSIATQTIDENHFVQPAPLERNSTIPRTLRAEWTKLSTLSSTWRTAVMAVVFSIGLGAVLCFSQANQWATMSAQQRRTFDPTACSLGGFFLVGAVLLGALAVRTVSAEYSTGMIRSTFTAMPARHLVVTAKAVVTAAFAFPVALTAVVVSFAVGQQVLAAKHLQVTFGHSGVLQALVFAALGVSIVAVIGVGLGGLIRHTAAATTALVLIIVGGVTLGQFLPAGLRQYLPGTALEAAVTVHGSAGLLSPGMAIVVLCLYAAATLAAASLQVAYRDA